MRELCIAQGLRFFDAQLVHSPFELAFFGPSTSPARQRCMHIEDSPWLFQKRQQIVDSFFICQVQGYSGTGLLVFVGLLVHGHRSKTFG